MHTLDHNSQTTGIYSRFIQAIRRSRGYNLHMYSPTTTVGKKTTNPEGPFGDPNGSGEISGSKTVAMFSSQPQQFFFARVPVGWVGGN